MKLTNIITALLLGSFLPVAKSYRSLGRSSLSELQFFETEIETDDDMVRDLLLEDREWEAGDSIRFLSSRRVEVTLSQQCLEDMEDENEPEETEAEVEEHKALLEKLGMKGCQTNSQNAETFTMYNTLDLSNCSDELTLLSAACEADDNYHSMILRPLIMNCTGFRMVPMDNTTMDNTTVLVQVTLNRHWEKGASCFPKSCPTDANDWTAEDIAFVSDKDMPANVSCTVAYLEDSEAVVLEQKEDSGATTAYFFSSASVGLVTASVALLMMW